MTNTTTQPAWTYETLGDSFNLGMPIFLFLIAIMSFVWFGREVKKKRVQFKALAFWFFWNLLYTIAITYVLIVAILHVAHIHNVPNIFNMLAHYAFGINMDNGKQWLILMILAFIAVMLVWILRNSIKIARTELRISELNKQVAILMGQVNRTTDYEKLPLAVREKTAREIKQELKEKVKIQKARIKAKEKIQLLSKQNDQIKTMEIPVKKTKKPKK